MYKFSINERRRPLWDLKEKYFRIEMFYYAAIANGFPLTILSKFLFCRRKFWRVSGFYLDYDHCSLRCPSDVKTTSKLKKKIKPLPPILPFSKCHTAEEASDAYKPVSVFCWMCYNIRPYCWREFVFLWLVLHLNKCFLSFFLFYYYYRFFCFFSIKLNSFPLIGCRSFINDLIMERWGDSWIIFSVFHCCNGLNNLTFKCKKENWVRNDIKESWMVVTNFRLY